MRFTGIDLEGAWLIEAEPLRDERGWFARTFCESAFAARGLETRFVQHSRSHSAKRHTLRGMHFQRAPHSEAKLVSCLQGRIFDVIADLRPDSSTYRRWRGFELTGANQRQLYVPRGFAHGFITLSEDAVVNYLISEFYRPEASSGVRFDDPWLAIEWPAPPAVLSAKDGGLPFLQDLERQLAPA